MHQAILVCHRWLALVVSAFLVVVALSGGLLVLEGPIARAHATHLLPAGSPLSLDTLAARVRTSAGGGNVLRVVLGDAPDLAWTFVLAMPDEPKAAPRTVDVNPYTGAILPRPDGVPSAVSFMRNVHLLHTRFLNDAFGRTAVTVVTAIALLLVASGLVIWWREKLWRVTTTASWKRINFDLHHSLGVFSALVLLVVTMTGLWVHYDSVDDLMHLLDRGPRPGQPVQPAGGPGVMPVSLDSLARAARVAIPGAAIMNIQVPPAERAPAMVQMKYSEDHTPAGRSRVYLDKFRGTALLVASTRTAEPGQHLIDIKRALHTGDIYGLPTQVLWALACLVLTAQAITGVLMWWNARAARSRSAERPTPS
ncbi:MAG: PepSY-associated TM helix domain-containing protein [Gemmatimonadales bacterium]